MSTVVSPPSLYPLSQMANANAFNSLTVTERFTSSNYMCPINQYYLVPSSADQYFDQTDTISSQSLQPTFTVTLRDTWLTLENSYSYEIVA